MSLWRVVYLPCLWAAVSMLVLCTPAWPESAKKQDLMTVDCPERLIFNTEGLSRTGICIRLDRPGERCRISGVVGGEHISYVGIKGRPGDAYKIVFTPVKGTPGYAVLWPDEVSTAQGTGPNVKILRPASESGIIIALSAHSYGEYELTVELRPGQASEDK